MGVELINPARHPLLHSVAQSNSVAQSAKWVGKDAYPAFIEWADEHEKWLDFAKATGGWDHLVPRLRSLKTERDEAMAEVAAAYFCGANCGYKVLRWEPPGAGNTKGEFLLDLPDGAAFTEVKSPGWEEEVVRAEGWRSPRLQQPKYINGEAKAVDACTPVRRAVAKTYPKLPDTMPTLLIIADDLKPGLNDSLILVKYALYSPRVEGGAGYQAEDGCFVGKRYERLGAVGILNVEVTAEGTVFRFALFRNPNALPAVALPRSAFDKYPSCDGLR